MPESPLLLSILGRFVRRIGLSTRRTGLAAAMILAAFTALPDRVVADSDTLPVPRFASLKSDEVNLRTGPGEDKPKLWVYQRAGMPVEIIEEFDTWRRVRDYQGVVGWVSASLLSGKRTGIVTQSRRTLRAHPDPTARAIAELDPGVIGRLMECNGDWCRLNVKGYEGWLKREEFWGVYPNEPVKE
jgi:SH3-like domain-containing protein